MQCYTELVPPTAVTHAVSLSFLAPGANNLVIAKTSLLQVFEIKDAAWDGGRERGQENSDFKPGQKEDAPSSKLVLVGEYPLSGTVTSLAKVKTLNTKTGAEALLVATKDAKVSLIDWDPDNHRISTISIHYYEGDKIQSAPFGPELADCDAYLTVDPSSRCAALRFGVKHLAILPFRQAGDDLVDEDYDPDLDPPPAPSVEQPTTGAVVPAGNTAANVPQSETPYKPSFVLPLTAIDPALTHPIHMAFLHEYREPTFGIVSASKAASHALLDERKDLLTYTVFTLDLEQRASTALLSVTGLPYDIFRVVPLPLPVGGALLVGANELVHVDQAGKTNAVGVNDFARHCSTFSMADQSDLGLRLEHCHIEALDPASADMMIILDTGHLAILSFRIDGRNVSGLSVLRVDSAQGGRVVNSAASCVAGLGSARVFVGSEDGESSLLGWSKKITHQSRKRSHAQMLADEADVELDEEDLDDADDDLYADESTTVKQSAVTAEPSAPGNYAFRIHDSLFSLGPITNVCLGKTTSALLGTHSAPPLTLLAATGRARSSKLAHINREITPSPSRVIDIQQIQSLWTVRAKHATPRGVPKVVDEEKASGADEQYDQYLITYNVENDGSESSKVFKIDNSAVNASDADPATKYSEVSGTEFEGEAETLNVGMLASGTRIVQVRKHEVRSYDADLGLSQIYPILDETTEEEMTVVYSSFCDPYLLVVRQDSGLQILAVDESGDLDELERGDALLAQKWLSGCLYKSESTGDKALAFLLSAEGGLAIFELPNLEQPVYVAPDMSFLPPVLSSDRASRRAAGKDTLTEILFADLGDKTSKSPYLILRSSTDDLIIYEPFHTTPSSSFTTNLRFRKVPGLHLPKYNDDPALDRPSPLCVLPDVHGYSTVFMSGGSPSFIIKEATSLPQVVSLREKGVKGLCGLNSKVCDAGFAYVDLEGVLHEAQLPAQTRYCANGWSVRKFSPFLPDHEIRNIAFHPERNVYIIITRESVEFQPPEDDHKHPAADEDITMRPMTSQYYVHLYDPLVSTIVHTLPLPQYELVTSLEVMSLEISEITHKHKLMVAVGAITDRAENFAARGALYVLDIIDVVPEPGHPETGKMLKIHSREDTKGGITALMGIAGLVGTAQGQKMMFRGLREDGSCLPVAFLDAQCYTASLKTLASSKLWLAADAWKGVWFGGFGEEPYKISLFGKSRSHMEVVAADFLPSEGQLYIIILDADMDMHILQYDPEHPKSLSGQRLLHRSTFHTGHLPTSTLLLPSTLSPFAVQDAALAAANGNDDDEQSSATPDKAGQSAQLHHMLITAQSGALALITPLNEPTYRRLSALQTTLSSILEHPAGLNPRAYRAVESEEGGAGARGVIDGDLICRIGELGAGKRIEVLGRAGVEAEDMLAGGSWGVRSDVEIIGGRGLGYL